MTDQQQETKPATAGGVGVLILVVGLVAMVVGVGRMWDELEPFGQNGVLLDAGGVLAIVGAVVWAGRARD